jgi:hypothetical protein
MYENIAKSIQLKPLFLSTKRRAYFYNQSNAVNYTNTGSFLSYPYNGVPQLALLRKCINRT